MGEINVQKAVSRLEEVAKATGLWPAGVVRSLDGLFKGETATTSTDDAGNLIFKQMYSEFNEGTDSWEQRAHIRRFSPTGLVYAGRFSTEVVKAPYGMHLTHVFAGGLGLQVVSANSLVQGAITAYKCALQASDMQQCAKPLDHVKQEVAQIQRQAEAEAKKAAEAARLAGKENAFNEARAIWDKVDNFLKAADIADSSDSDSDVLKAIVKKHTAARALVKPETLEGAVALRDAAQRMLAEFEASPHLEKFVMKKGEHVKTGYSYIRHESCGFDYHGSGYWVYEGVQRLGGFSFPREYFEGDCKRDRDWGGHGRD